MPSPLIPSLQLPTRARAHSDAHGRYLEDLHGQRYRIVSYQIEEEGIKPVPVYDWWPEQFVDLTQPIEGTNAFEPKAGVKINAETNQPSF